MFTCMFKSKLVVLLLYIKGQPTDGPVRKTREFGMSNRALDPFARRCLRVKGHGMGGGVVGLLKVYERREAPVSGFLYYA